MIRHVIAALVSNEPGVLANVAGMFAARGYNIDSLVVGRTENPAFSRMTIVVKGDSSTIEQVRKQLGKLVETVQVVEYGEIDCVERDLMLCRISTPSDKRHEVMELANLFRARIVDVGAEEMMIEMAGDEQKIEAFIDLVAPYGIIEMARTGVIAMRRGEKVVGKVPVRRSISLAAESDADNQGSGVDAKDLPPG